MSSSITPRSGRRLRGEAGQTVQHIEPIADAQRIEARECRGDDEIFAAIDEGLADLDAGRTVSLEEVCAAREVRKAARGTGAR